MSTDHVEPSDTTTAQAAAPSVAYESAGNRPVEIVLEREGRESRYAMFRAHRITLDGVFLYGPLFLEPGEEVVLALPVGETDTLRAKGRVVALEVGATFGMHVHFSALDESAKARIQELLTHGLESPKEES